MTKYRDKELLEELYIEQGMSSREVAEELDTNKTNVLNWLKRHNLEARTSDRDKPPCFHQRKDGYEYWVTKVDDKLEWVAIHQLLAYINYGPQVFHPDTIVHHRSEVPWDNRLDNLEVQTRAEHGDHHTTKRWKEGGDLREKSNAESTRSMEKLAEAFN